MMRARIRLFLLILLFLIWIVSSMVLFQITDLPGSVFRYFLIPPLVLMLIMLMSVRYLKSVYQLSKWSDAVQYYLSCMFGLNSPILVISEGKPVIEEDKQNLVMMLGGPGILNIHSGSVAVVENVNGNLRVLRSGYHFLSRSETLKDSIALETRFQPVEKLAARSKDGIEVVVKDIRYRFRVHNQIDRMDQTETIGKTPDHPSDESILKLVYNRPQTSNGIGSWEEEIRKLVELIIRDYIQQHQVDYLVAPKSEGLDPRAEIYSLFNSPAGKKRFEEKGAELVWIDIGHFETPEQDVSSQRVTTWRARWLGNENLVRDYADAQAFGRAEAQSNILMNIVESLESTGPPGESRHPVRPLYLARIAQLIEAMTDQSDFEAG